MMMAATVASLIQQIVDFNAVRIIKGVANVINLIDVQSVC